MNTTPMPFTIPLHPDAINEVRRSTHGVEVNEFNSRVLPVLVEGSEFDVLGRSRPVGERALDGVEVVRADGHQGALPATHTP